MARVGIKELKAKLSEHVELARSGEPVIVTDRGEPVAELVGLSTTKIKLLKLAESGVVSWNGGKPKGARGIVVRGEPMSETVVRNRQ